MYSFIALDLTPLKRKFFVVFKLGWYIHGLDFMFSKEMQRFSNTVTLGNNNFDVCIYAIPQFAMCCLSFIPFF